MEYYDFCIQNVQEAGERLTMLRDSGFTTEHKGNNPRDIVTSADRDLNEYLVGAIHKEYPDHRIYSEEGAASQGASPYVWTLDPIDGSSNFSRGIPHFAIAMGLLKDGVPLVGAVYNPVTRELFSFKNGEGAWLNGKPITVSAENDLARAQVIFGGGRDPKWWDWAASVYRKLLAASQKRGLYGCSSLDLCFLAAGRVEAVIYTTLSTLDVAPAFGILKEAGGIVEDADSAPLALSAEPMRVFAANSAAMLADVRQAIS